MTPFARQNLTGPLAVSRRGFSLIELIVVMAIGAILTSIAFFSLSGSMGQQSVTGSADTIKGVLDLARVSAMSGNTYVWVGFFEEDPATPGTTGTGQVVISVVRSNTGVELYSNPSVMTALPPASLGQVIPLKKLSGTHLDVLSATAVPRPSVPAATYQVASSSFPNLVSFVYPLTGAARYTFTQVIEFSPQGDATRVNSSLVPVLEIGLRPAHGNAAQASSANLVAIQIGCIGGQVQAYRP